MKNRQNLQDNMDDSEIIQRNHNYPTLSRILKGRRNDSKPAITMAEIIIVMIIVAIVAGVFLAMPKKNVSKLAQTKYYVAYSMLKQLQDEQIAQFGCANVGQNIRPCNRNFANVIDEWLNVVEHNRNSSAALLSNGMVLGYARAPLIQGARDRCPEYGQLNSEREITIQIEGDPNRDANGNLQPCIVGQMMNDPSCVSFKIYSNYSRANDFFCSRTPANDFVVIPWNAVGGNFRWIAYRVYWLDNNSNIHVVFNTNYSRNFDVPYQTAEGCAHGSVNNAGAGCAACAANNCFVEVVPPIK